MKGASSKRKWSLTVGSRPYRVRVYEVSPGGMLYRSVYRLGKEHRKSLGHRDKNRAKKDAILLSAALCRNDTAIESNQLTLALLIRLYLQSPAFSEKSSTTQSGDRSRLKRIENFLGGNRLVISLCQSDIERYAKARLSGIETLLGVRKYQKAVRPRSVEADIVALKTAVHWAMREKHKNGSRLLQDNPLLGVSVQKEKNVVRPYMRHDHYEAILSVADEVHPYLKPALVIAEGTARRLSAIRQLQWSDIDFVENKIRWRAETDKKKREYVTPMPNGVLSILRTWRDGSSVVSEWVFPLPTDSSKPCDRHRFAGWLERAYRLAKLPRPERALWHSLRRKFATERKNLPPTDVAEAGGWKDTRTVLKCYTLADDATVREVINNPTRLMSVP